MRGAGGPAVAPLPALARKPRSYQQPYIEGDEAVDVLWLYLKNGDTVGGGGPVLTGPFFVTKDDATAVALSGGQRQCVAIARAIHFGARVLILDEPTAALGVTQSGIVLKYVAAAAREQSIGVIFITHNPHHAYMVGDHFIVLARGEVETDAPRSRLSLEDLMFHMAGGAGLQALEHELHLNRAPAPASA